MAVYTSINYQQPVNSGLVNEHTSEVIAPGVYRGMYVRSHGANSRCLDIRNAETGNDDLNESRTDLFGLAFMPQGMKVYLSAPQMYNENDDILSKLVIEPAGTKDRIDLVCLHYEYKKVIFNHNKPSYVVIKGPDVNDGGSYNYPNVYTSEELDEASGKNAHYWERIRIPMAYVVVKAGKPYITDDDIINIRHSMNTNEIIDYISSIFNDIIGNCRYNGWQIRRDGTEHNVIVSPGFGMIDGRLHTSTADFKVQDIRPQIVLMTAKNPSQNLSLTTAMPYASAIRLQIKSTATTAVPAGATFKITGVWVDGASQVEATRTFTLSSAIPANGTVNVVTDKLVRVNASGLNLTGLTTSAVPAAKLTVTIYNMPIAYILGIAQYDNRPRFRAEYDPRYVANLPSTEIYIGRVEVDNNNYNIVINGNVDSDKILFSIAKVPDLDPMFARARNTTCPEYVTTD